MSLAIVKPDHLGDLILSRGAIRALLTSHLGSHLYVSPKNMGIARFLFPEAEIFPIFFPHLNKGGEVALPPPNLMDYSQVAMLRHDNIINPAWMERRTRNFVIPGDTNSVHQSIIDYRVARTLREPYNIDEYYFGGVLPSLTRRAKRVPRRIGISIGSGFHANSWPVRKWTEVTKALLTTADEVVILCGHADVPLALSIERGAGSPANLSVEVGSSDFGQFLSRVKELDLVIATDGGTAHLCSLVAPVLSIFGPSPFRRYAPFGGHNRLITRDIECSPCCQYAAHLVNSCLSMECMTAIPVSLVYQAVTQPSLSRVRMEYDRGGAAKIWHGVSHLNHKECFDVIDC